MKNTILVSTRYSIEPTLKLLFDDFYMIDSRNMVIPNEKLDNSIREHINKLTKQFSILGSSGKFPNDFDSVAAGVTSIFDEIAFRCIKTIAIITCIKTNITGVLLNSWGGAEEIAMYAWANNNNVPTILMGNGIWPKYYNKEKNYLGLCPAKYIFCVSEYTRDLFKGFGYDNNKLIITGLPYFDIYNTIIRKKKDDKKVVLCGFDIEAYYSYKLDKWIPDKFPLFLDKYYYLYEIAESMPDFEFWWLSKPWGTLDNNLLKDIPLNVKVYDKKTFWHTLIDKADVALCFPRSTIVMESLLVGIPTVIAKLDPAPWDFLDANVTEVDWEVDKVCDAIREAYGREDKGIEFRNRYFSHNQDGKAAERVANEVRRICE